MSRPWKPARILSPKAPNFGTLPGQMTFNEILSRATIRRKQQELI
jgi:hypothetical protein